MAVKSRSVSVGDTATRLDSSTDGDDGISGQSLAPYNNGAATIYVGGSDVTTANGCPIPAASWGPSFDLAPGEALYGIVATGTVDARILEQGI